MDLVIVDEAHHAAAPSYQPIFDRGPLRGLFLTATPNRTDELPIGIDEIAYTITYRELFRRGVLVEPTFEEPLTIDQLDWDDSSHLRDLADYILNRAADDFDKTMVVASRVDHVERLYETLRNLLEWGDDHPVLSVDDVHFVHGGGTSTGAAPSDLLDEMAAAPKGIILATSQMLGEGFDDPAINAVVITYPSSSLIQLMQAAGRCLRAATGKERAWVVQVRDSDLGYHYEQRWLYQDISDYLRPQLIDRSYADVADLAASVESLLDSQNVSGQVRETVLGALEEVEGGQSFSLLLTGRPYHGPAERFRENSAWNAVPVTERRRNRFVRIFNDFSARDADVQNHLDFLGNYLRPEPGAGSEWKLFVDMLHAMRYARMELRDEPYANRACREFRPNLGTSWLTYVTFRHDPVVPAALEKFLDNAHNRQDVLVEYLATRDRVQSAVKIPLPLSGTYAFLLDADADRWLTSPA